MKKFIIRLHDGNYLMNVRLTSSYLDYDRTRHVNRALERWSESRFPLDEWQSSKILAIHPEHIEGVEVPHSTAAADR